MAIENTPPVLAPPPPIAEWSKAMWLRWDDGACDDETFRIEVQRLVDAHAAAAVAAAERAKHAPSAGDFYTRGLKLWREVNGLEADAEPEHTTARRDVHHIAETLRDLTAAERARCARIGRELARRAMWEGDGTEPAAQPSDGKAK